MKWTLINWISMKWVLILMVVCYKVKWVTGISSLLEKCLTSFFFYKSGPWSLWFWADNVWSCSAGAGPDPLSRIMGGLRLETNRGQQTDVPLQLIQSEEDRDRHRMGSGPAPELHQNLCTQGLQSEPAAGPDYTKVKRTTAGAVGARSQISCLWRSRSCTNLTTE